MDLRIAYSAAETRVVVRPGLLADFGAWLREVAPPVSACVVTDDRVGPLYADDVEDSLRRAGFATGRFTFPAGEASKSLAMAGELFEALAAQRLSRDGVIVALGGGVASDLAGFAAATWMRGVPFAICPTTVESCVDACLGGKTGVNLAAGKNLVGAFHHPVLIAADPLCFATLDPRETRAGLAESIKHALLFDPEFLTWHDQHVAAILAGDPLVMAELVARNLQWKARVVQSDERETRPAAEGGLRRIFLNFGHTIGHAIESAAGYELRHGECVALGMVAALRLGRAMGVTPGDLPEAVVRRLAAFGLPTALPPALAAGLSRGDVLQRIRVDKKAAGGRVRFVLLADVGRPIVSDDVSPDALGAAYDSLLE
jgi:3-dehydroquinate synthase